MFSATFPKEIQKLASEFMLRYVFVAVGRVGSTTQLITQTVVWAEEADKRRAVLEQLSGCSGRTIIFVETKRAAEQLEDFLYRSQVPATSIHGDRTQRERENALQSFRRGQPSVLVATDVAARGLDVPECMNVINYELPRDINSYVHRIGRTGRMGRTGCAISLFTHANRPVARDMVALLQEANQVVPEWLLKFASEGGAHQKGYQNRKFGGRDYRANAQVRQYRHNSAGFPGSQPMGGRGGQMGGGWAQQGFMAGMQHKQGGMYNGSMSSNGMPTSDGNGWVAGGPMYGGMGLSGMQQPMAGGSGGGYQQQMPGGAGGQRGGGSMYGGMGMAGQPQFAYQYGQQGAPGGAEGQASMGGMVPTGIMWSQGGVQQQLPGAPPMASDQAQYGAPPQQPYGGAAPLQ